MITDKQRQRDYEYEADYQVQKPLHNRTVDKI